MSTQTDRPASPPGGIHFSWLLAAPVRSFVSKASGATRTVVELRDPARLGNSLVLFLDGEAGPLANVPANTRVTLRVDEVRSGSHRGELIGSVSREAVMEAFTPSKGAA